MAWPPELGRDSGFVQVGRPHDVAMAILYLASSRLSGHLTGQVLTVAGGMEGRVLYQVDEIDPTQA